MCTAARPIGETVVGQFILLPSLVDHPIVVGIQLILREASFGKLQRTIEVARGTSQVSRQAHALHRHPDFTGCFSGKVEPRSRVGESFDRDQCPLSEVLVGSRLIHGNDRGP